MFIFYRGGIAALQAADYTAFKTWGDAPSFRTRPTEVIRAGTSPTGFPKRTKLISNHCNFNKPNMTIKKTVSILLPLLLLLFTACQNEPSSATHIVEPGTENMQNNSTKVVLAIIPEETLSEPSNTPADTLIAINGLRLAKQDFNQGRLQAALGKANTALDILEKYPTTKDDLAPKIKTLMASILLANQEVKPAYQLTTDVFNFYKNKEASVEKGNGLKLLSSLYLQIGQLDSAFHYIGLAEETFQKVPDVDPFTLASLHQAKGSIYYLHGQSSNGLKSLNKAKAILEKRKEERPFSLLITYRSFAAIYSGLEEYDLASSYLDYSLNLIEQSDIDRSLLSSTYVTYGNLLAMTVDPKKAIRKLERAELLMAEDGLSNEALQASLYYGFGTAHYTAKQNEKSIARFEQAVDHWEKTRGEMFPGIASCYGFIADAEYRLRNPEKAKEWYAKALAIDTVTIGKHHVDVISFYRGLAEIEMDAENYNKALNLIKEAYFCALYNSEDPEFYRNNISPDGLLLTLQMEGDIYLRRFLKKNKEADLINSLASTDKAIQILDHLLKNLVSPSSIKYLFEATDGLFETAIKEQVLADQFYQRKPSQKTFDLFERAKDILILENLRQNDLFSGQYLTDPIFLQENEIKSVIDQYEQQLFKLSLSGQKDGDEFKNINTQLFEANSQRMVYEATIRKKYPKFSAVKYNHHTVSIKEVQDKLLQPDKALVEYFVGDSSIFVFTISKNDFHVTEIKKDFPLEQWTTDMLQSIADLSVANKDRQQAAQRYTTTAHQIHQKIIAPITRLLPAQSSLIIIPDGILGYLPFDALLSSPAENVLDFKTQDYLIRNYQISYGFSSTLLAQRLEEQKTEKATKKILAFAPSFKHNKVTVPGDSGAESTIYNLSPLRFNESSVLDLKKKFKADVFIGDQATKSRFIQLTENYQIIHLATHGKANNSAGKLAFLAFAPENNSSENTLLYNREIYKLKLNANLVVLSACETAIGERQLGEGIISLARGFSYAGAKSVVTTLWNVNDNSSQILMDYFYDYLKQGLSKDAALKKAKMDYLSNDMSRGDSPYYWAGVVAIGDMNPILVE